MTVIAAKIPRHRKIVYLLKLVMALFIVPLISELFWLFVLQVVLLNELF